MGSTASDLVEGTLGDLPMSVVLTLIVDRVVTGTLHIAEPDGAEHHVRLRDGRPTKIRSSTGYARLGDLLVERGVVTRELVEDAAGLGGTLGDVLELAGRADRVEVERAAQHQLRLRVVRLFSAPDESTFRLVEGWNELEGWGVDVLGLDPLGLLLSGVRDQPTEGRLVHTTLSALGERELQLHRLAAPARFGLADVELAAVELITEKPMGLGEWIARADAPAGLVRRLAFALLLTRHLGTGEERNPVGVIGDVDPSSSQRVARVVLRSNPSTMGATSEVRVVRNVDPRADPDDEPSPISLREHTFDAVELVEVSCELAEADDVDGLRDLGKYVESQLRAAPTLIAVALWLRSFDDAASPHALLRELDAQVDAGAPCARLCRALLRYRLGHAAGAQEDFEAVLVEDPTSLRVRTLLADLRGSA